MEAYRDKLVLDQCKVDLHIHFGSVSYNMMKTAREIGASIIVLGTTGKSYLRGMTLGSIYEEVVKRSTRPMLLIPT